MKTLPILTIVVALFCLSVPACNTQKEQHPKVIATSPQVKSVTITQQYVCQIQSGRRIDVRSSVSGSIEEIRVKEGQQVKQGDLMFKVIPPLYKEELDTEMAETQLAQAELDNSRKKFEDKAVPQIQVARHEARLAKAKAQLEAAELNLTIAKAPFDGIVGRMHHHHGSKVEQGETITSLSDNSFLKVYFNVPEALYVEYMAELNRNKEGLQVDLVLSNGDKFQQTGKIGPPGGAFNNESGTISFRVDFPNPDRVVRHGQSGTVLVHRVMNDALVIPQRATFEYLHKRSVYVIDKQNVVHSREIVIQNEVDDLFVIKNGLDVNDKIVLEGFQTLIDGDKVELEDRQSEHVVAKLKQAAK